ncbi:MAG: hypothetical protein WBR29_07450 [Gammaproteobacteria bacterium]
MRVLAILTAAAVLLASTPGHAQGGFCDGYQRGYITGYKQASGSSLDPLPPLCPFEPLRTFGDPESDFEFGYTIGYRAGLEAAAN